MKTGKKSPHPVGRAFLGLLLCASMLLGLAACSSEQTKDGTTGSGSGTDNSPAASSDNGVYQYVPSGDPLDIVKDGASDYSIIYPADCIAPTQSIYVGLRNQIRTAIGFSPDVKKDSDTEPGENEILIGKTNRAESAEAMEKLSENQFSFNLVGKKIVIAASDDACMKLAVQTFVEHYAKDGKLTVYTGDFPVTYACGDNYKTVTVDNTADIGGDDPYVVKHDGYYYYCWSENGVKVTRLSSLAAIKKDKGKQVFNASDNNFQAVWAPELHYIDGNWYIYVSMCKGTGDNAAHRMYCLRGTTQDPTDPFELMGQVTDSTNKWAIDGTVFKYKGELYTVWSGWPGDTDGCQNLYIAHMSNPWTIDSNRVQLSTPSSWDNKTQNPSVNEGPFALVMGDTVYLLYSGNGSWSDEYCVGYLTFSGSEIMQPKFWKKSSNAFLTKSSKTYGPGHCSVVQADDGSYQIVYHANLESGTGWSGRSVRIQEISVTEEGIKLVKRRALESDLRISNKYVIGPVEP